jgi:hypothetical protein
MDVLRHWADATIYVPVKPTWHENVAYALDGHDLPERERYERIEVVRADLHRRAVEERDRLREYIQRVLTEDLHAHADSRAWSRLREALYLTGGQS